MSINLKNTTISGVLFIFFALTSHSAIADELALWQFIDASSASGELASILLPEQLESQQAIKINGKLIEALSVGDKLSLETTGNQAATYTIEYLNTFLNGDIGLRAGFSIIDQSFNVSLTQSRESLLATVYSPNGKFSLLARIDDSGDYLGWLFSLSQNIDFLPKDLGGYPEFQQHGTADLVDYSALTDSDVMVEQTLSSEFAIIGSEVTISVEITNKLATPIEDEDFTVLFTPEVTDLVSSASGCTLGSTGAQASFDCPLPTIAANSSTTIEYVVRIREEAYPQIDNAVFVGDLFGENVRTDDFIFILQDTTTDSDGDGVSDYNEELAGTNPNSASSVTPASEKLEVDLMFLYTERFVDDLILGSPETDINQMVLLTNGYYAASGANVEFRPVYYGMTDYEIDNINAAMEAFRESTGPGFTDVPAIRDSLGADIVVLVDGFIRSGDTCGVGSIPGADYEGEIFHPLVSNSDLYITLFKDGGTSPNNFCPDDTLAHELGHNFGVAHSRRDSESLGIFDWSHGHGIDGSFSTIMAYSDNFPGSESIPLFSSPTLIECNGMPCGVSRDDLEQGADAVHTINHSRFQIANRRESKLIDVTTANGDPSGLIMFGGATKNGNTDDLVSNFAASDNIDVRATL